MAFWFNILALKIVKLFYKEGRGSFDVKVSLPIIAVKLMIGYKAFGYVFSNGLFT